MGVMRRRSNSRVAAARLHCRQSTAAHRPARRSLPPQVKLTPSPTLRFLPNPDCDPLEFANLQALASHVKASGYYGGLRLLQAMCKCFFEHCVQCGISLAPQSSPAFTLSYATTIPRQVLAHTCSCLCAVSVLGYHSRTCPLNAVAGWLLPPLQCGLSGSSAIVCATLNCLLCHYGVEAAVPHIVRPALVLSAEQDLGITAGLQDRVVQASVWARLSEACG